MLAERAQGHPRAQQKLCRLRHDDLPAVRERRQPRGPVDLRADVRTARPRPPRRCGVPTRTAEPHSVAFGEQAVLEHRPRPRLRRRRREGRGDAVGATREHVPAVLSDDVADDRLMEVEPDGRLVGSSSRCLSRGRRRNRERHRARWWPGRHGRTLPPHARAAIAVDRAPMPGDRACWAGRARGGAAMSGPIDIWRPVADKWTDVYCARRRRPTGTVRRPARNGPCGTSSTTTCSGRRRAARLLGADTGAGDDWETIRAGVRRTPVRPVEPRGDCARVRRASPSLTSPRS